MARHEADREDLFTEAAGLVRKLEGILHSNSASVILAGFRVDAVLVVYFGSDPMFQWDESGRLRRAYADGRLYRAQGSTLARLTRSRSDEATTLLRHDLTPEELAAFRARLLGRIEPLATALETGCLSVTRRWPADDDALPAEIAERLHKACTVADWIAEPLRR